MCSAQSGGARSGLSGPAITVHQHTITEHIIFTAPRTGSNLRDTLAPSTPSQGTPSTPSQGTPNTPSQNTTSQSHVSISSSTYKTNSSSPLTTYTLTTDTLSPSPPLSSSAVGTELPPTEGKCACVYVCLCVGGNSKGQLMLLSLFCSHTLRPRGKLLVRS